MHVHCTRVKTHALQYSITRAGARGRGAHATRLCSRQWHHVHALHPRHLPHLRGIFSLSVGYVERRALHPTKSRAKTTTPGHHRRQEKQNVPAAQFRQLLPASLAQTAAIRTSAVEEQGSRTPDRDLPRFRPRVQTRSRIGHRCSAQNGAV
jgi:hypothetical protein